MIIKSFRGKPINIPAAFLHFFGEGLAFTAFICGTGILFLFFFGCAKVGAPTGGIKDTNPPVYLEGNPENRSLNFAGEEIEMAFDEFIQLKDQNKEVMISPPMKKKPIVRIREKSIRITLNNELLPQTTYTINFGNAITDLNEGNILPDFEFVFSTGNTIDSLSVTGKVLNAFDRKPSKEEEVLIMLYEDLADSAPLIEIPRYLGKANKAGIFSINNIHADTFRILALKDANSNQMYDPGIESVAFTDSFLVINAATVKPVTFIKDTVKIIHPAVKAGRSAKQESARAADTTIAPGKKLNAMEISLFYFLEETTRLFLETQKRDAPEKLFFTFNRPPFDTVRIAPLNFSPQGDWYVKETSRNGDTLTCWITDTLIARQDTLKMALSYQVADSAEWFTDHTDTVAMRIQKVAETTTAVRRGRTAETAVKKPKALSLATSIANRGTQHLNKPIVMIAERPLGSVDPEGIEFYRQEDSLMLKQPFIVQRDSLNLRAFTISCSWQEDSPYKLLLKPGTVTDIYGLSNDSLEITFATQREDYYGRILVTAGGDYFPLLVQLTDEKEKVMEYKYISQPGLTVFDYLLPRKYLFKVIYDKNENRKWDTGNYLKHVQPEKVYYYTLPKELRSNWDVEVDLMIKD
jgi:hypothetical protein